MDNFDFKSIIWRIKYWFKEVGLGIKNVFRKNSIRKIRNLCLVLLGILFIISIFYHLMGRFTVTVDSGSQKSGLYLYNTREFLEPRTSLFGSALQNCNNISVADLPLNLDDIDGKHYGRNYLAYTFYARNDGIEVLDYEYSLYIGDSAKNVDAATWIMLFKNGEFEMFAKAREDGSLERQYSYDYYPIFDQAADDKLVTELSADNFGLLTEAESERLGIDDVYGLYEFRAKKFVNNEIITKGVVKEMEPGEYDKYTVVAWLEGEDPDCIDDILGGYIEMNMSFEVIKVKEWGDTDDK